MNFVAIRKGKWEVTLSGRKAPRKFDLQDKEGLRAFFAKNQVTDIQCSSSVDFPQEDGAPKGFTGRKANEVLQYAVNWAQPLIDALRAKCRKVLIGSATPEDCQEVAARLLKILESDE